jgi:copper oxidase (laccase) domain-containing protein
VHGDGRRLHAGAARRREGRSGRRRARRLAWTVGGRHRSDRRSDGLPAQRLLAWLGPAIGPKVYEVGAEVREAFVAKDSRAESAFAPTRPGHWNLDLYAVARQRLASLGITRVSGGGFCTHTEKERFFSYRRDKAMQRMAAAIWLQSSPP